MSYAIWADYLGGHPEFERPILGGQLRIDDDSPVLTYLAPQAGPKNPVDLTIKLEERFIVPIDTLQAGGLDDADLAAALASAARGSILFGAYGVASALDSHMGSHLTLAGALDGREFRLSFTVNEADGSQLLARVDGRRSSLGLAALGPLAASQPAPTESTDVLALIAHRLEEQGKLLTAILERLPPK